jgi:aspartate-semialdehyde dehydrogenase
MTARIPVTVLGATGVVGQRFVRRLAQHPWFAIRHLAASEKSRGKRYAEACEWRLGGEPYAGLGDLRLVAAEPEHAPAPVVFSALDAQPARELEPRHAAAGSWVFSNASAFRLDDDVPLLVPEVNAAHLDLVETQRARRGWTGAIVCNPNCTATVAVMALGPLHQAFGVEAVVVTSMQAVSGAGYPGVPSLDILGNVVPYIQNEEEKLEAETRKMLGRFHGGQVDAAVLALSASCNRVAVIDGHTESLSVRLRGNPGVDDVRAALATWRSGSPARALPTAPVPPILVHDRPERPQPRLDLRETGAPSDGMTVHVGRIRPCAVLGTKLTVLGHNAERGAAGASVLNAELTYDRGLLSGAAAPPPTPAG